MSEKPCTFLVHFDKTYPIMAGGIKADLKYGDAATKVRALKHAIALIINGDTFHFRDLSIIVLRHVLPCENLTVQKLVLLYLETVYKGEDVYGRVPPDTTLVLDHLLRNLQHRYEYIRGLTLRFISRLEDPDLLEPLVESILVNLYHRHRFVRRHAYSAVFAVFYLRSTANGGRLLPDALDRVEHKLSFERDPGALRNAFFIICTCARERAVAYLLANADRAVAEWPDIVQVLAITLIRRACCSNSNQDQGKLLIGFIVSLLSAGSNSSCSVVYEAADALLSLCSEPVAVCAAANAYLGLLSSRIHADVKRIVLERLRELRSLHSGFILDLPEEVPANCGEGAVAERVISAVQS